MNLKKIWGWIKHEWPLELSITIFLVVAFLLLTVDLNTLLGGVSQSELNVMLATDSFPEIKLQLVFWPYYLAVYLTRFLITDAVLAARVVSAGLGLFAVINLIIIITRWYSSRVAVVGATVFISGSWFLQIARSGTPEILGVASLLALFTGYLWLINRPGKIIPSIWVLLVALVGLFVPLLPWLIAASVFLAIARERTIMRIIPRWFLLLSLAYAVVAIVVVGYSQNYQAVQQILGIPEQLPSLSSILTGLRDSLAAIFWYAPTNPERWLANLPLLDIFGVVMFTLGVYHHEKHFGSRRSLVLFGSLALILILLAFNNGVFSSGFSLLLPIAAVLVVSGIQEYLGIWTRVFPRNPLARLLAVGVLSTLVTMSSFYQLNRYFIAWPNSPETKAVYSANIVTE